MTELQFALLQVALSIVLCVVSEAKHIYIEYMLTRMQRRHLREQSKKRLADDRRYVVENGPYR